MCLPHCEGNVFFETLQGSRLWWLARRPPKVRWGHLDINKGPAIKAWGKRTAKMPFIDRLKLFTHVWVTQCKNISSFFSFFLNLWWSMVWSPGTSAKNAVKACKSFYWHRKGGVSGYLGMRHTCANATGLSIVSCVCLPQLSEREKYYSKTAPITSWPVRYPANQAGGCVWQSTIFGQKM